MTDAIAVENVASASELVNRFGRAAFLFAGFSGRHDFDECQEGVPEKVSNMVALNFYLNFECFNGVVFPACLVSRLEAVSLKCNFEPGPASTRNTSSETSRFSVSSERKIDVIPSFRVQMSPT